MSSSLPLLYVIGDSISIQYGPHLEQFLAGSYRYQRKSGEAEALLNLDNPLGANGGDSNRVLGFLHALAQDAAFAPDVLAVNCGLHDIKWDEATARLQVDIETYRNNLHAIVELCASRGWNLVWIKTTSVVDEIHNRPNKTLRRFKAHNEAFGEVEWQVMSEHGIPVANLQAFTDNLGTPEEIFCDHVHYTEDVRRLQAAFLTGWLQNLQPKATLS